MRKLITKEQFNNLSNQGDFFYEVEGESFWLDTEKPLSCFSTLVQEGKSKFVDVPVCRSCKNYFPCAIQKKDGGFSYDHDQSKDLIQKRIDPSTLNFGV